MANFFIIIDPNAERRSHFIKNIESRLPPVAGLTINSCTTGDFQAIWAIHPQAPISCIVEQQEAAIIWGEAIIPGESTRLNANGLKNLWRFPKQCLPPFDGFYAAAIYHPQLGLTLTADILGLFPIYYYIKDEVALVASSPELFRYHPLFTAEFNPAGLVGILLTNGLVNGQALWKNIKRLDAGHCLIIPPKEAPKEIKQYEIPALSQHQPYKNLSYSEHLELLEHTIDQTLKRHTLDQQKYTLLLSGGLDSRMLAGFLHRQGKKIVTLTLGKPSDIEMQCAIPVARTLGLEYNTAINQLNRYPLSADLLTQWEHLSSGFNGVVMGWSILDHLNQLASRMIGGFSLDTAIGGPLPVTRANETLSFEIFWNRAINNWGISPEVLNKLLRREVFGDLVQETLSQVRQTYESYSDLEFRRSWWYELYQRQRFHVGAYAWRFSFGAWPVLPALDIQLLKTTLALPIETMYERRAQNELLCKQFPQLAQLPLDRNGFNVEPLLPSKNRQKLRRLLRLQQKWRRWQQKVGIERRYYYQIFDINNTGWQSVRHQAEPYRPLVQHLFHEDVLNKLVPPPNEKITCRTDAIIEASGIKAILGLLLWSKDHL